MCSGPAYSTWGWWEVNGGGGREAEDVTPSFQLCSQDDSEQSNVTAGI